jgi:D-alanyl-D-alanine carboxypeptidase
LDENGHYSTAKDLVRVAEVAMKNPRFAEIVGTKEIVAKSVDGKNLHKLVNINALLGNVEGVLGVKTGWTENARENLVTYLERDNHKIMIALLGSQDRFGETKEIIDWIFRNYQWREVKLPFYSP